MTQKPGLTYVDWRDVEVMVYDLVRLIMRSGKQYKVIAGVTRGGLVPAVMLSHMLKLPMIAMEPTEHVRHDDVLIVDEIYDTGKTIEKIKSLNPKADIAVLFHNEGLPELDYYVVKRQLNDWIVFPWEHHSGENDK